VNTGLRKTLGSRTATAGKPAPRRNLTAIELVSLVSAIYTMARIPDLLPGTLDLLILRTLQKEALHGWAVSERIQQISEDVLQVNQGSLYPALHRLEHQGRIEAEWKVSELGRRAKYYSLTASGRRQLAAESKEWERMSHAIGRVMKLA
jgi:PadR family transcriptional regulator, regulatory protein PadR